jgi:heat shock protein HslJ
MIASTKMACEKLADEGNFFKLLAGMTSMYRGAGHMTLQGGGHELTFLQPITSDHHGCCKVAGPQRP